MLCSWCNGSGEGQYDGSRCQKCKGLGEDGRPELDDDEDMDTDLLDEIF